MDPFPAAHADIHPAMLFYCPLANIAALKTYDPPLDTLKDATVTGAFRRGKFAYNGKNSHIIRRHIITQVFANFCQFQRTTLQIAEL